MPFARLRRSARRAALLGVASALSLGWATGASAACTANPNQPLNAITTDSTIVLCNGIVNGPTITAGANGVLVDVNGTGTIVTGGSITVNGNNGAVAVRNNGTLNGAIVNVNGVGNTVLWGSGATSNNLIVNVTGANSQLIFDTGSQVTQNPGQTNISSAAGESNNIQISAGGGLFATGGNGQYLINGGTGNQNVAILGFLVGPSDGLAISLGDGDDSIAIGGTASVFSQSGSPMVFNGGTGNDIFSLNYDGVWQHNTVGFEVINVNPNTSVILSGSNADVTQFNVQGGNVTVTNGAVLGVANSTVNIGQFGNLRLNYTASANFNNMLTGSGGLIVNAVGNTVTFNGDGSLYSGDVRVGSGSTAVIGNATALGTGTFINDGIMSWGDFNLTNNITGSGGLVYTGVGTGDLSGNNSFSGGIDIRGGSLRVVNVNALGTGAVTSTTGGVILQVDNSTDQTLDNDLTGALVLAKTSTGILDITGTNSYTGGTLIDSGAIRVDAFSRLGSGPVVANANGSLILNYNGAGQLLQTTPFLSGAGSFIKEGSGDVVMSLASTYTGGTTIRAGRIGLNNGDALGTGTIQIDSGAQLGVGGIILNNALTGTGLVRKTASNIVEFYGDNSGFTGTIEIADGSLYATNGDALGAGTLLINGGTGVELDTATNTVVAADLAGTGTFETVGAGRVVLTGDGTAFAGALVITAGTVQIEGSQNIGGATVLIDSAGTLLLDTAGSTVLSNSLLGAGNVVKTGSGTVFLTGNNSYTGGTAIQQGAIRVADLAALGTGPVNVAAGAALDLSINGSATYNGAISGAGILRKSDVGDLTLLSNTLTGGLDIVGGRVIVNDTSAIGAGNVTTAADTQLVVNITGNQSLANLLSGAGTLTKEGTGLLAVNTANSYTGGTLINSGRLVANASGAFGTGTVTILQNAELGLGGVTLSNAITGAGAVFKTANNVGMLTGNNTHSGGTFIQGGTLLVNSPAALGTGTVTISAGAALGIDYNGSTNVALNNVISGAGGLFKLGTGTVVINNSNTFTGGTQIAAGTLGLNFGDGLGTGSVTVDGGATLALGDVTLANAVNGAGRIVKTSAGVTTLTGTNTYSGGTVVMGGQLVVNSANALGTGAVSLGGGTQLVFDTTGSLGSSVTITGAGSVIKRGSGLLTITNANSHGGGTFIEAGRLVAANSAAFGTGTVTIAAGAEMGVGDVLVANVITGAGRVVKTAAGVGMLTGVNSHGGGTDIQGGTLIVNSPAALGSGGVSIGGGTTLQLDVATGSATLANALTGAGALVMNGAGTVNVTGTNGYSGGTLIAQGRLNAVSAGALGTGAVQVNSGAQLGVGDINFANAVSGAGQIVKAGSGSTTLTGTNTHSGGTLVQAGTLNVGGLAPLGTGTVTVGNGATLNFASATPVSFANTLTGAGTFRNSGTGQLTFANNFTMGTLDLVAGRTRLNAVGTTNVQVGANATLDGTGRIVGNVTNNGTVAPGNSIGTLTVQGNYIHNAGSVLEIEFDGAGNIDLLAVTGSATLNGGTLRFVSIGGAEGSGGTFLTAAGGVTGTFATVQTVGAALPLAVVYEPNRALMAPSVLTARPSTFNAQSLAAADTVIGFIGTLTDPAAGMADGRRLWMNGFGAWNERSASGSTLGYSHDSHGLAGGVNLPVGERVSIGAAVGWSSGDIRLASNGGGGEQSALLASAQVRHESANGTSIGGGVLYGRVEQSTVRNVAFNGFAATVTGDTESTLFGGFAALNLPLYNTDRWQFGSAFSGAVIRQSQDGYTEGGTSPLRLTVADIETTTWQGEGRLYAETRLIDRTNGGEETSEMLTLRFDLGARYQSLAGSRAIPVTFAASNAGIVLEGDRRDGTQAFGGIALAYTTRGGLTASLGYEGETGRSDRHMVRAGVSIPF